MAAVRRLNNNIHETMQAALDEGNTVDQIVDYLHAEVGTQKTLLLEEIAEHSVTPGSKGAVLHKTRLEAEAKALALAEVAARDKAIADAKALLASVKQ